MSTYVKCDGCGKEAVHERSRWVTEMGSDYSFIVLYIEANEDADHGHFCSWGCLAAKATDRAMTRELDTSAWATPSSSDPQVGGAK